MTGDPDHELPDGADGPGSLPVPVGEVVAGSRSPETAPASEDIAPGPALALSAPAPATAIRPTEVEQQLQVAPEVVGRVERLVEGFLRRAGAMDVQDEEFGRLAAELARIGEREMIATAQMSARLLEHPIRAMGGLLARKAPVARNLAELRVIVEDLDPHALDDDDEPRGLFAAPRGDPGEEYFERYAKAQGRVQAIVASLGDRRAELIADTAAVEQEQRSLWAEMEALRQYAFLASRLDEALVRLTTSVARSDPDRARALQSDLVYPVRQRRQDLLTQLAIATQGFAALQVVEHNNREVIRAIQAATPPTGAALRTAVAVAQATAARRALEEQLGAAERQRRRGRGSRAVPATASSQPAADVATNVEALRRAWGGVISALDQIDRYALEAAAAMRTTVRELGEPVQRSREVADQLGRTASNELDAGGPARRDDGRLRLP